MDAGRGTLEWLGREMGFEVEPKVLSAYFERQQLAAGALLYRQGTPADTIGFIADGTIAVVYEDAERRARRLRHMARQTVVGEMGFFRNQMRTASVVAEGEVVAYTLSRASFERMRTEQPALAAAFLQFIIRTLADRLEFADKEVAALITQLPGAAEPALLGMEAGSRRLFPSRPRRGYSDRATNNSCREAPNPCL